MNALPYAYRKHISIMALAGALAITVFAFALATQTANAHQDPLLCDATGVGISITALRADGTTPVGAGSVESGETIKYRTTLSWAGGSNCNFEGGSVTITTPDGAVHAVGTPGLVSSGSPFVSDPNDATYVTDEGDVVGGFLSASTGYTGGTAHQGEGNHPPVSASTGTATLYQDVSLEVSKTAHPAFESAITWSIDKSVDVAEHNLLTGESASSTYTIVINKTVQNSNYSATGTITIHNPAQFASATVTSVDDVLTGAINATVVCPGDPGPYVIAPGADLVCTYSAVLPDDTTRTNTATVTTSGDVGGDSGEASVDFTGVTPTLVGFNQVTITDTNSEFADQNGGDPVQTSDDVTYNYDVPFTCDADEGTHPNTATIVETAQSDDATVTVNCLSASIDIEKATNGEDADAPTGPVVLVGSPIAWTYVVTNTGQVDLDTVVVVDDQGVVVSCPQTTLAVGESMICTANGVAEAGQYANIGTVTGQTPSDSEVSDTDPSHYFGEEPEVDFQGCTPGYWKQSQHFDSWVGYAIGNFFDTVFGVDVTLAWSEKGKPQPVANATLLQALGANGGGINALARHATAALLNAANPDVEYAYTEAEIIDMVQDAVASGDFQTAQNLLATQNELGCPLN